MKYGSKLNPNCNPSTTKSGPGRFHKEGHKKNSPIASKGAPRGFVVNTNPMKNALREKIAAVGGIRQFKRARSAPLRALRDAARA